MIVAILVGLLCFHVQLVMANEPCWSIESGNRTLCVNEHYRFRVMTEPGDRQWRYELSFVGYKPISAIVLRVDRSTIAHIQYSEQDITIDYGQGLECRRYELVFDQRDHWLAKRFCRKSDPCYYLFDTFVCDHRHLDSLTTAATRLSMQEAMKRYYTKMIKIYLGERLGRVFRQHPPEIHFLSTDPDQCTQLKSKDLFVNYSNFSYTFVDRFENSTKFAPYRGCELADTEEQEVEQFNATVVETVSICSPEGFFVDLSASCAENSKLIFQKRKSSINYILPIMVLASIGVLALFYKVKNRRLINFQNRI